MSSIARPGKRLAAAINLRNAALALLHQKGKQSGGREGHFVFEEHTPENPTPLLSVSLLNHPLDRRQMVLNVWAMHNGKHVKVLNLEWLGETVQVTSFRRGEWESELLAMGRASAIAVH